MSKPQVHSLSETLRAKSTASNRDEVLLSIEGKEVTITTIDIERIEGRMGDYSLTTITLDDGRTFRVAGQSVSVPLGHVNDADLPVKGVFSRKVSTFDPSRTYWTVE